MSGGREVAVVRRGDRDSANLDQRT